MKKVKKFVFLANRKIGGRRKYIGQVPFAFSRLDTIQDSGQDSAIKLANFSFGHLIPQQAEDCPVQGIKLSTSSCILCVCVLTLQIIPILHTVRPHCLLSTIFSVVCSIAQTGRQGVEISFISHLTSPPPLLLALFLLKPLMGMKTSYAPQILRSKNFF